MERSASLCRRHFLRLGATLGAAAALAACAGVPVAPVAQPPAEAGATQPEAAGAQPVEITYWSNFGPNYGGRYEELMVLAFKEKMPHVTLNRVDMLAREKVQAEFAAGRFPDVMPWYYPEIKSAEKQLSLNELIDRDAWDVCQMWLVFKDPADDKIYGINQEVSNTAIWYDRPLLAEIGVDEPTNPDWTWEEFVDFCQTATVDNNGKNAKDADFDPENVRTYGTSLAFNRTTMWAWLEWLWQAGGDFYNEDETQVVFDSEEGIAACKYWVDLVHTYHVMPLPGSLAGGLGTGLLSTSQGGSWNYGSLVAAQQLDMGTIDLPQDQAKASLILPGYWHVLNNGQEKVDASWEWLKYRVEPDNVVLFSEGAGYLPIRRDVAASERYTQFLETTAPQLKTHIKLLEMGRVQPTTHLFRPQLMQIHGEWFEKALMGAVSPEEAMVSAAEEINSQPDLFAQATAQGPAC